MSNTKTPTNFLDLTGLVSGKLKVINRASNDELGRACWNCVCECKNHIVVKSTYLVNNTTISCGCFRRPYHTGVIDLTGKVFGKLRVLERVENNKNRRVMWKSICECGAEVIASSEMLRAKGKLSCGGTNCKISEEEKMNRAQKALFVQLNNRAKHIERKNNPERYGNLLTFDEFVSLITKPCFYCNRDKTNEYISFRNDGFIYLYTGIDRIDSYKPYTKSNCVSCCYTCNYAKNDMNQEDYFEYISEAYNNLIRRGLIKNVF